VFDYIKIFYNATRRHSTSRIPSPARYEVENHWPRQLEINYND
jgi:hypothetical protein